MRLEDFVSKQKDLRLVLDEGHICQFKWDGQYITNLEPDAIMGNRVYKAVLVGYHAQGGFIFDIYSKYDAVAYWKFQWTCYQWDGRLSEEITLFEET
jgi:hypothetical protein